MAQASPIATLHSKVGGIIRLEVKREDGTLKEAPGLNVDFNNLVVDSGLNNLASNPVMIYSYTGLVSTCQFGTSNTPPANGQTNLVSPSGPRQGWDFSYAVSSPNCGYVAGPPPYQWQRFRYIFPTGALNGNYSEIGFFSATSGGSMFSRALIKDEFGNPTTITILPTEQLTVTYELRRYPPTTDTSGVFNLNGTDISWVARAANINDLAGAWPAIRSATGVTINPLANAVLSTNTLGSITSFPAGAYAQIGDTFFSAYTNGTFYRDFTVTASPSQGNVAGGIGGIGINSLSSDGSPTYALYQMSFTPKIDKTNVQTLTFTFRISWGRL